MRKLLVSALFGLVMVVSFAAPALALRDPFDPVISQAELSGSADGTGNGTGDTAGDGTGGNGDGTTALDENGSEGLATTGADIEPWLVAAYTLIAVGAGAVALARISGPPVARRSTSRSR